MDLYKKINFGKIDYFGTGRKINSVVVKIELRNADTEKPVFTASAYVYNIKHTDCVSGGQCLDDLERFFKGNKLFNEIVRLWKLYHLNDMNAGDLEQTKAVNEYLKNHNYDYKKVCLYLDSINLLEHNGYRYGTAWIYFPIPSNDLDCIKQLFDNQGL